MAFNLVAMFVAAVLSFAFGAAWYMSLGKPWMAAIGKTEAQLMPGGKMDPTPFVIAIIAQLVLAYFLGGLIDHIGDVSIRTGLTTAFFAWLAFVMTTLVVNHRFQRSPWSLTLIDGGHWLGVFLIQGLVLGWWNATPAA